MTSSGAAGVRPASDSDSARFHAPPGGVLVIGASVGGSIAALSLARAGVPVTVIERHEKPWDKVCGEGMHPAGLQVVEELIGSLEADGSPFRGFCFRTPETRELTWRFPGTTHGLGVDRTVLTGRLIDALEAEPMISLHRGQTVTSLRRETTSWFAETTCGPFSPYFVVGADGVTSRVRKWAGLERGSPHGRWGARRRYTLSQPFDERVTIQFLGNREIYLTPLPDQRLSVAVLGDKDWILGLRDADDFEEVMRDAAALPEGARPDDRVAVLPHQGHRCTRVADRGLFLVGDAAVFLDPITGAGMTLAALGGAIAAEAIVRIDAGVAGEAGERWYARELERAIAPFAGLERFLGWISRSAWVRRLAVAGLARAPGIIDRLARPTFSPRPRARCQRVGRP